MPTFLERVRDVLRYDPETGDFIWLVKRNSYGGCVHPGEVAGSRKDGYIQIIVFQQPWRAHRLAWLLMTGELPPRGFEIDHINGDRSDNRWANLRQVTRRQNNYNLGISKRNRSGTKGVSWAAKNGKWLARLKADGRIIDLGYFENVEDAAAARKAGERRYHGEFARADRHPTT